MSNGTKAKAPRPGVGRREEEAKAASQVMEIRIKDATRHLPVGGVPMRDRQVIRNEMGTTFEKIVGSLEDEPGPEAVFVLWFLAGRQENPGLPFGDADAEFTALLPTLGKDDLSIRLVEPGDSPEA